MVNPKAQPRRSSSRIHRAFSGFVLAFCLLGFVPQIFGLPLVGRGKWTEFNIGPFYLYTRGEEAAAREQLTQFEQLRWVLGGLLDSQDLPSPWPIRVIFADSEKTNPRFEFVRQSGPLFGQLGFVSPASQPVPLQEVAAILLDGNTPRLPAETESGLRQLLGSIQAHGSHVTWGGPVAHPDLAWARMQLFATKFEYSASFHVFVSSLRNGSTLRVAERNAFNRDPDALEREAAANLQAGHWTAVSISGRPLDPKRDLGEHAASEAVVDAYLAANKLDDAAFRGGIAAGGEAQALGYEGLAAIATRDGKDPKTYLQGAAHAGSRSAPVYFALGDFKTAASLNPRWAAPIHAQAEAAPTPQAKEELLRKAVALDPRATEYWIELAELQGLDGHVELSNGSWFRAEDSAGTPEERDRIEQLRAQKEQERLQAEADGARKERDQAREADQKAQDDEMARIHAAEERANGNLDAAAGGTKVEQAIPWQDSLRKKTLTGTLVRVDCLATGDRVAVRDRSGHVTELTLDHASKSGLSCGPQNPPHRVTLTYAEDQHILSFELK